MVQERFIRNIGAISEAEQAMLADKRVFVAGCGGLGGGVIDCLARLGVGGILCDFDTFEQSNLNRQLICTTRTIGAYKAEAAREYAAAIAPQAQFEARCVKITDGNAAQLISGCSAVIDALDNPEARQALARACAFLGIPLISGAVDGWCAQVCVLMPQDAEDVIARLFPAETSCEKPSVLPFTAMLTAAHMSSMAAKLLLGRESELTGRLLCIDLLNSEHELINLT